MSERCWLSLAFAAATGVGLLGCVDGAGGGPKGGQIGGVHEGGGCEEKAGEDIGADDVSPLGFSAREALSAVSGERSVPLTWATGGSTTATLSVGELVAARFAGPTDGSGSSGAEPGNDIGCSDHLQIDVPMAFSTEDGAFDDSFEVTLRATQVGAATFTHAIDLAALQGSYEVTEVDPAEFREVFVWLIGMLSSSAVEGSIGGLAESYPIGSGPDAAVAGHSFRVAEF
ncbi:hypothetical protein WME75_17455 [Sorangium sp. So ce1014]|uniref:hypothetical protein n=1 Tax=Sorangium sp. So ce1014 TaxID=3133326 RepID=UPI003F61D59E